MATNLGNISTTKPLFFICASKPCGERTHDRIKRTRRCKGRTVQRSASTQSPSFYSCLSGCSHVWVGQSNFCWCRWRCTSHSAPSHWPRRALADTYLKRRRKKERMQRGKMCRGFRNEGALTEADRFWSPAAIGLAGSGRASHQHETRATGVPHHRARPPVVTKHHAVIIHIWRPTIHCNGKWTHIPPQADQWSYQDCGGFTFTESFVTEPAAAWVPTAIPPQLPVLRPTASYTQRCWAWPVCVIDD